MTIENQIRAFAGVFILASVLLAYFVSPYWLYFTGFVGLNLLQSAVTRFCPLEILLRKMQHKSAEEALPAQGGR
jgi:Protein of unknown function (DUF2892)